MSIVYRGNQILGGFFVIRMGRNITISYHVHPDLTLINKPFVKGMADSSLAADNTRYALFLKVIFHHVPGKFKGKLKTLDGSLLFKVC